VEGWRRGDWSVKGGVFVSGGVEKWGGGGLVSRGM
jgi:hypothetical protein